MAAPMIASMALSTTQNNARQSSNTGAKRFGDTFFRTSGNSDSAFDKIGGNIFDPQNITGLFGGKKKDPYAQALANFKPYAGYKPPHAEFLRPVEKQITDIVMSRSLGNDVGYDPARRQALQENFDIEQSRQLKDQTADIKNRLSGMGLSRNVAANEELLGRALRHADEERNLYTNRIDIEDLARRNEERDVNTARLQDLNTFNFGQENKVADFDLSVYNAENTAKNAGRGLDLRERQMEYDNYEDPFASALGNAYNIYDAYQNTKGNSGPKLSSSGPATTYDSTPIASTGSYYKDTDYKKSPTYLALNNGYVLNNR